MLGNWIKETTTTTGTGALTLASVSGYPTFASQFGVGASGEAFYYAILNDSDGTPIEAGIGHLSDATTLVRDKVLATYSAGAYSDTPAGAVTLAAGTKRVICASEAGALAPTMPAIYGDGSTAATRRLACVGNLGNANWGNLSTLVMAANTLSLASFSWACARPVDSIYADVATAAAGKLLRLGIYATQPDGGPGKLLIDSGDLSAATATMVSASITPVRLPAGWYYSAMISDGTPGVRGTPAFSQGALGFNATTGRYIATRGEAAATYGALPDPAPAISSLRHTGESNITPLVWLGVS